MNQKTSKEITEFTDKQMEAYKLTMKALSYKNLDKRALFSLIKSQRIYQSKRDIKEVIKMIEKNPNTPIKSQEGKLVNKYRRDEDDI